jgi:hypothetical protein
MRPAILILACLVTFGSIDSMEVSGASEPLIRVASGPPVERDANAQAAQKELTPEQKMQRRYPHPIRVGDLIGLPVLDDDDSTIGYVREVVRSPQGKVFLIVPYSAWFGWARTKWGKRPVAVPIEVVAILARQIDTLDMSRDDFNDAPTWAPSQGQPIGFDEKTLIALGRR